MAKKPVIIRQTSNMGPLQDVLIKACPPDKDGVKSVPILAGALELSNWAVYGWIRRNYVPTHRVQQILRLPNNGATMDDFTPFLFNVSSTPPKKKAAGTEPVKVQNHHDLV